MFNPLEQIVTEGKSSSVTGFAASCGWNKHPKLESEISYLEGGDGDLILPFIEVFYRQINREPKADQGGEGPQKSVHRGKRPLDRFILQV